MLHCEARAFPVGTAYGYMISQPFFSSAENAHAYESGPYFEHACEYHSTLAGELSSGAVVTILNKDSSDSIFSIINCISDCNSLRF